MLVNDSIIMIESIKMAQEWQEYEEQIFKHLKDNYPKESFKKNDSIEGRFSKTGRQVDISSRREFAGSEVLMVIDCKCFNTKVDVKDVDSFIGFLDDLGAQIGVLITNNGYTKAAKNRAQVKGIRLDIVEYQQLDDFDFDMDLCKACDPGDERPPAVVHWASEEGGHRAGRCDWCNTLHIKCDVCGGVAAIEEVEYDELKECEGGCGLEFKVVNEYIGHGMCEQRIEIIKVPKK